MAEKKTELRLGPVVVSFPKFFKPEAFEDGGDPKYSGNFLIPLKSVKTIAKVEACIAAAKQLGKEKKAKWKGIVPKKLNIYCFREGEEMRPDDKAYKGMMVVVAKSDSKPACILKDGTPASEEDIYSGVKVYVTVNFAPYDTGSNGITCFLGNILKAEDSDRLDGRKSAEDDFSDLLEDVDTDDEDGDFDERDLGF